MCVCLFGAFGVEEGFNVNITGTFPVSSNHILGIPNDNSHLILFFRSRVDIPSFSLFTRLTGFVDFYPHFDHALADSRRSVFKLSVFNWFFLK